MASLPYQEEDEGSGLDERDGAGVGRRRVIFPAGLPGFWHLRHFHLMTDPVYSPPFELLASDEDPDIGFYLIDPILVDRDYAPDIPEPDCAQVGVREGDEVQLRAIVTVGQDPQDTTANLAAPLILNRATGLACQAILDATAYSLRTPLVANSA